ncbi:MAG: STAS domain-containing protein [Thermodesulfovibrionales bacterium]|nr:STAS domain-containing protein [Thermodesulfovibrionales bacterium]
MSVKPANNIVVIMPKGYVNDLGAERLEHVCEQFLAEGLKKIVINFSEMQFINSIGASVFTGIVQKTLEYGGRLYFTNMKKIHRDVFEMLGITKHVSIFKDERDALDSLPEAG